MKVIDVKHEKECPSPHVVFLRMTPIDAAGAFTAKFGQDVDTVYQRGNFCYIPLNVKPDQFWSALNNGC